MRVRRTLGHRTAVHLAAVGLVVVAALSVPVYEHLSSRPAPATLETVALVDASITQDYPPGCVPDELVSVEAIDATGRIAHPHVGDGLGRRYTWRQPGGSATTPQILPPAQWRPLHASAAELQAYGFPARPTDPGLLLAWEAAAARYVPTLPGYCSAPQSSGGQQKTTLEG